LRGDALAALGDAARRPLLADLHLLSRLPGSHSVAHPLNIGAGHAVRPQLTKHEPQVMFDPSLVGFQRRRLFVAHSVGDIEID
jgi:hypothetical protein